MTAFQTPARAARRKILRDRMTEKLTEWGSAHAEERAAELAALVDELGFALPAVLEDTPGPPPPRRVGRTPAHAQAMDEIRAVFDRDRRPAFGGSA